MEEFNALPGWTCYPETGGFDVLVVHEDGRQIGVEAKLKLNAKVADQILPGEWDDRWSKPGPDHRMVIVGTITEANYGICRMLAMFGIPVLAPTMRTRHHRGNTEAIPEFDLSYWMRHCYRDELFDWNPESRCAVPIVVPDLPAGVPCPVRFTPWKEAALRVLAQLRRQGFITAKQIAEHKISSTSWTQGARPWLRKGDVRGQWVETEHMPKFDEQHPEAWAKIQQEHTEKHGALL